MEGRKRPCKFLFKAQLLYNTCVPFNLFIQKTSPRFVPWEYFTKVKFEGFEGSEQKKTPEYLLACKKFSAYLQI